MDNTFQTLLVNQPVPEILILTLNRPRVRNAINHQMMVELDEFWKGLKAEVRCIIITGAGDAFCAGADLKERLDLDVSIWLQQRAALESAMLTMINCSVPIIAAVNGAAFGGGLELALASDFIYAATTAKFAQSETKLGIIPGAMGTQHLPQACGLRRAKELCFTAEAFSAEQALQWNIVNKLCEPTQLMSDVLAVAQRIVSNAPLAVQHAKKAMNVAPHNDIETGFQYEIELYDQLLSTADREEGIRAFNEKRPPKFQGK